MNKFGFSIKKDNLLNLSKANLRLRIYISEKYPSYNTCINCGICSATCTSAKLTTFNIRNIKLNIDRGLLSDIKQEVAKCMLCGKCEMTCPRGISNRHIVVLINKFLQEQNG